MPIPSVALADDKAVELLRAWAARGGQHVSINVELWDDPASWGIMLVDLARHIASAYGKTGRVDERAALKRLREGFDAEWASPTGDPDGDFER
jgi:hypothetical protein